MKSSLVQYYIPLCKTVHMYLSQLVPVFREAFLMQPLVASVAYCSGCPPPLLCAADNALGLFLFMEFSESSWSLRIISSSVVLQCQPLLPQALDYGHSVIVLGFQFARPLVEIVAFNTILALMLKAAFFQ
jgi:hypothetical protein